MIPLAKPLLSNDEAQAAYDAVMSGWVMQGPRVADFERHFAEIVGATHACAVSSGTAALILALMAVGVKPGDVVLTVSHSFIATANAVRACGAEPVFVDISGYNLDSAALSSLLAEECQERDGDLWYRQVEKLLGLRESPLHYVRPPHGRVAAILTVHQIGIPCDLSTIASLSSRYGLPLVEDAACAIGSRYHGEAIGKPHGDIACFSFHPRKILTTGDGGMITCKDAALDQQMRLWRQHGMTPPPSGSLFEGYACTAFNYRLTDIQAAIGLKQLERLPDIVERRRALVDMYRQRLAGNHRFALPTEAEGAFSNWQSLPLEFDGQLVDQESLIRHLQNAGVAAKPGIMNSHEEAPYKGVWCLPESEKRRRCSVFIPLFHDLTEGEIDQVVSSLESFC